MSRRVFSLEGKGLKFNSAADIEPYLKDLTEDVEEIRLSGNTLGVEASIALSKLLRGKTKLQNAQMADIFTGRLREEIPAALDALLPALLECPNLHTINLCDNAFGLTAADPLERFLSSHTPLKHLHLQNNGMGPEAGARMASALAKNQACLETIVCGRNRLENGSTGAWVKCFAAHTTLKCIKMPQNGIRPEGIERLMRDGLSLCTNLEIVDMQDNTFTKKGSVALAGALSKWSGLKELAIGDCLLGKRGSLAVAEALRKGDNKALEILRLQYNEITSHGVAALHKAIELGLPELSLIELNGNVFADDEPALEAIRELFEQRGRGSIDDLEDLEEPDSDAEEEASEVGENEEEEIEDILRDADEEEEQNVAPTELDPVDAAIERNLAEALAKAKIK